jgi:hypothetical protein
MRWIQRYQKNNGILGSPLMIFLGIIEFISLISFWWYRWCHDQRFNVSLKSFSFFIFFSPFFYYNLCGLFYKFFKILCFWIATNLNIVFFNYNMYKLYYFIKKKIKQFYLTNIFLKKNMSLTKNIPSKHLNNAIHWNL